MVDKPIMCKRLVMLRGNKTQEEVGNAIGISRARYSHYETGRSEADQDIVKKLADYFGVTTDFLYGMTDDPNKKNRPAWLEKAIRILSSQKGGALPEVAPLILLQMAGLYAVSKGIIPPSFITGPSFPAVDLSEDEKAKMTEEIDNLLKLKEDSKDTARVMAEQIRELSPQKQNVIRSMLDALSGKDEDAAVAEISPVLKYIPIIDPIANLPYIHQKLKALREEQGITIEEAAAGITAISNNFLTEDILRSYEEGRSQVEPSDQASIGAFYNVSWAFISGRTNVRVNEAGVVPTLEAANRTDDPTQPLPLDAQKSLDEFYKKHGLYCEEGGTGEKEQG